MSAYWGPQSGANYYTVRGDAREDLKEVVALELEDAARNDAKPSNSCKDCGHILFHANIKLAQECGKVI
jgi:hypothetical protein